jgi:hypothetical protein
MKKNNSYMYSISKALFLILILIPLFYGSFSSSSFCFSFNQTINVKNKNKIKNNNNNDNNNKFNDNKNKNPEILWKNLFIGKRGENCKQQNLKNKIIKNLKSKISIYDNGIKLKIKKWGFGAAAYFFDFLDSIIRKDIVKEFINTYETINSIKAKQTLKEINQEKIKIKKLGKKFDCKLFKNSVTYSQLKLAIKNFRWKTTNLNKDYTMSFINKYDLNKDGRLNPRELILGIIDNNRDIIGKKTCKFCFENTLYKLDAIFKYIDCNNKGYINSEQIWYTLKKLQRPNNNICNIYHKGIYNKFRTTSVNDFVLKNQIGFSGVLNLEQWRIGLLLGIWDRQSNMKKIIFDDSLNLKKIRWGKLLNIDVYLNKKNKKIALGNIKINKNTKNTKNQNENKNKKK